MISLRYKLILILIITLFQVPAIAQDDRYRVEIVVLKHLRGDDPPQEQAWLKDYSDALDFLTPAPEPEVDSEGAPEEDVVDKATAGESAGSGTEGAPKEDILEEVPPDPDAVVHIEEMSPPMQDAWRRLRLSGPFRPLQFLAWEQGRNEPFPELRVHDLDVVLVDDPYADLRALLESGGTLEGQVPVTITEPRPDVTGKAPAPPPQSFQYQTIDPGALSADLTTDDEAQGEDALPDPTLYYALDGTASLVRTRFLHLYLDIQLREAVFEPSAMDNPQRRTDRGEAETEAVRPDHYRVHSLRQNRQVKTGRMEYFDGPVISVLAYITPFTLAEDEPE